MGFNSAFKGLKIVKKPCNGRLNNLNDPVLIVLRRTYTINTNTAPNPRRNPLGNKPRLRTETPETKCISHATAPTVNVTDTLRRRHNVRIP